METLAIIYFVLLAVHLLTPGKWLIAYKVDYSNPKLYISLAQTVIVFVVMLLILL